MKNNPINQRLNGKMISKEQVDELQRGFADVGSWSIWSTENLTPGSKANTGDMTELENIDPKRLRNDFIIVGLNASIHPPRKDGYTGPWRMFHSDASGQQDFKMRLAFYDTPLWGNYMTDIIKDHPNPKSQEVTKYIKDNGEVLETNIDAFKEELRILGGNPIIIALGRDVEKYLKDNLDTDQEIHYLPHYSHFISDVNYKIKTKELLEKLNIKY